MRSTRQGFGQGIIEAAQRNPAVCALTADLTESTGLLEFSKKYSKRFIQVGVAEQNLVTVASGLAHVGKIPFATSFAAFSPGRNWEQIRTTICYNNQPVIIVGSHTGLGVGEDGATHQMLEDIALMRTLPNMTVVVPCDFEEARKATIALAKTNKPAYLRLGRQKVEDITKRKDKFEIGKANVLKKGKDVTIIACGPMVQEALRAADSLSANSKLSAEVINLHTIKPIDKQTILRSVKKTKKVITIEDHQIHGGMGSAVCELIAEHCKTAFRMKIMGINDEFGESGPNIELYKKFGLTAKHIFATVKKL